MTRKSTAALKTERPNIIFKNGKGLVKAEPHGTFVDDILDSFVNWITDENKLNLREYSTSLTYTTGVGVLYTGKLYQANKNTGPGAFVAADWDEITAGGGGGGIFLGQWIGGTSYNVGEYVVNTNNLYECTIANSDASFTPGNWSLKVEGNIVQTAFTTAYTPTTPANWGGTVPTETGGALDILIQKALSNASSAIAFVAKTGSDVIGEFELGNPLKPFLTIQAAINALPSINGVLQVLGGDFYNETVTIPNSVTKSIFLFNNCRLGNLTAQFAIGNRNIIKDLRIESPSSFTDIRPTYLDNVRVINTVNSIALDSEFITNCIFSGSYSIATIATLSTVEQYIDNCIIENTGTGHAVRLSPNTVFSNCRIESLTNNALDMQDNTPTIQEVYRLYNCTVKSTNIVISGDAGAGYPVNMLAYGCKFYSSNSNILFIGTNSKFILFQGCEFYTKSNNDVITMSNNIVRNATDTYTFKECTFHTVTGYPLLEPTYGGGDLGNTLFLNCVYNAASATLAAPNKLTEHNSFSYPNYTDFNNLQ